LIGVKYPHLLRKIKGIYIMKKQLLALAAFSLLAGSAQA
jgi:hypothetical protein